MPLYQESSRRPQEHEAGTVSQDHCFQTSKGGAVGWDQYLPTSKGQVLISGGGCLPCAKPVVPKAFCFQNLLVLFS